LSNLRLIITVKSWLEASGASCEFSEQTINSIQTLRNRRPYIYTAVRKTTVELPRSSLRITLEINFKSCMNGRMNATLKLSTIKAARET